MTVDEVRRKFEAEGVTIRAWAKANGFKPEIVYALLLGRVHGRRGAAHKVAVALGLKRGVGEVDEAASVTHGPAKITQVNKEQKS